MRHILHQNADTVSALNAAGLKPGGNAVGETQNVRVSVFFNPVGVIQYKRATLRTPAGPVFQTSEDPAAVYSGIGGESGNLGPCVHAPVE